MLLKILVVLLSLMNNLQPPFDKFGINIHSILIEAIVEIISQLVILRLPVAGIQVKLIERVSEKIPGLDHIGGGI